LASRRSLRWLNRAVGDVRVRRGTVDDVEAVAHVHRLSRAWYYGVEAQADDGRETMWADLVAQAGRTVHVAQSGDAVVGFMSAIPVEDSSALEMTALYVLPEHVRARVGSRLHDVFDALRRPHQEGVLEVWQGNHRAVAFYARRGWVATAATRPGPRGLGYVTYRLPARGES
jgi:ribosomal protein S18 acetylase RimI-like enzyme